VAWSGYEHDPENTPPEPRGGSQSDVLADPSRGIADAPLVATLAGESSLSPGIRPVTSDDPGKHHTWLDEAKIDGHRCVVCRGTIFNCPMWDS
jgi:hypothetical protein